MRLYGAAMGGAKNPASLLNERIARVFDNGAGRGLCGGIAAGMLPCIWPAAVIEKVVCSPVFQHTGRLGDRTVLLFPGLAAGC